MKIKRIVFHKVNWSANKPHGNPTLSNQLCVLFEGKMTQHGSRLNLNQELFRLANGSTNQINGREFLNVFHKQIDFTHTSIISENKNSTWYSEIEGFMDKTLVLCNSCSKVLTYLILMLLFIHAILNPTLNPSTTRPRDFKQVSMTNETTSNKVTTEVNKSIMVNKKNRDG
jgi:hypothetical protein